MTGLHVVGNISRDLAVYPDGRRFAFVGGAAFHVALAATAAGMPAAPIAVIGQDLARILHDPRLRPLDLSKVGVAADASCSFTMTYDPAGKLQTIDCDFGASATLTAHALRMLDPTGEPGHYHVCCRRPLDPGRILKRLAERRQPFSIDVIASSAPAMLATVRPFLPQSTVAFVNALEYRQLSAITDPASVPMLVITDGPRPVRLLVHGQQLARMQPPPASGSEVTGAGDTLAGTFLATYLRGAAPTIALQEAVTAASASLDDPICPILPTRT